MRYSFSIVVVSQHNGGTKGQHNNYSFHSALAIKQGADKGSIDASSVLVTLGSAPSTFSILQQIANYKWEFDNAATAQKSERNPDDLSDRQLLAQAYEGLAKTEYEKKKLEEYKGLIAQLDTDTAELARLRKQIHDKTFITCLL